MIVAQKIRECVRDIWVDLEQKIRHARLIVIEKVTVPKWDEGKVMEHI